MARTRVTRRIPEWAIGLAITLVVLVTAWIRPAFLEAIEYQLFDLRLKWFGSRAPTQNIAIVAIDEESITKLGRWPWPRSRVAALVDHLAAKGARVIGLGLILSEPEEQSGLTALHTVEEKFQALGSVKGGPEFLESLRDLRTSLDNDAKLVGAVQKAGTVLLPGFASLEGAARGGPSAGKVAGVPEFAARSALTNLAIAADRAQAGAPRALEMTWPLPALGEAAVGIGHINRLPDADGISRWEPLLVEYRDQYFPHFALAVAAQAMEVPRERIRVAFGDGILLGTTYIPTDSRMRLLLNYYGGPKTFPHYSAFDVLNDKIAAPAFQGKIVLVGATAPGIGDVEPTPLAPVFPGVEKHANLIANLQEGRFLTRPAWGDLTELAAVLVLGLLTSLLLPRLGAGLGSVLGAVLFAGVIAAGLAAFAARGIWLGIATPALLVALNYVAITSRRFLGVEREKEIVEEESDEANKLLGLTFQGKGMLDLAWEKFARIPADEEMKGVLYNLALDFERKRQPAKALTVYERIASVDKAFRDIADRMTKVQAAATSPAVGGMGGPRRGESTAILEGVERPTLGRYELVEELGRGAMGIVYKGLDPKINRTVAIKTVHFDDVEEAMLPEVKERFFREAQAAGGLNHPNILTIYDSGEEMDVAWIAMEFLSGKDLERFCQKGNLLPWSKALEICAKVADALKYAHTHGVVHRDIKPANIMLLENGEVKVTDFGIARVVSSSQTKTGMVMGSPSYMSPEQIAGKKVDGRSDLFSLGVVLYELFAGERPFQGDSLATIMFQITGSPPPPLANFAPRIPPIFQKLAEKALAKNPAQRFQTGEEFAKTLRALKDRLDKAMAQADREPRAESREPRAGDRAPTPGAGATARVAASRAPGGESGAGPGTGGGATQQMTAPPGPAEG
ncbi:MAG: CHASE2 domain-containing protein [candidate division NC10 bacterium]|nr:CHASE2 domain-containing protein [candidate division NC10 bacterium]